MGQCHQLIEGDVKEAGIHIDELLDLYTATLEEAPPKVVVSLPSTSQEDIYVHVTQVRPSVASCIPRPRDLVNCRAHKNF